MPLHIVKLCVGAETVEDLEAFVAERCALAGTDTSWHQTRMSPKRREDVLDGGSLYWVIKGQIAARQRFRDIVPVTGEDGIARCRFLLEPAVIRTCRQPRKAFQGWRYLQPKDAPADLSLMDGDDDLPPGLREELHALGIV